MTDPAIACSGISKTYRIPASAPGDGGWCQRWHLLPPTTRRLEALSDVSLSIAHGESVALVGRNGSGKSTLLRILAGVTTPTSGNVHLGGRISALLELGAGLHPELTGWENIFLSGRLSGMSDRQIRAKLHDIADFCGLGPFLDSPIKTYSSGMFARLAFTLATSIDPTIVVIDEILSVGDAEFQARSFGRIRQFRESGRTLVIVSHHSHVVEELCTRAIWLERGRIRMDGPAAQVMAAYHQEVANLNMWLGLEGRRAVAPADIATEGQCSPTLGDIKVSALPVAGGRRVRIACGLPDAPLPAERRVTLELLHPVGAMVLMCWEHELGPEVGASGEVQFDVSLETLQIDRFDARIELRIGGKVIARSATTHPILISEVIQGASSHEPPLVDGLLASARGCWDYVAIPNTDDED